MYIFTRVLSVGGKTQLYERQSSRYCTYQYYTDIQCFSCVLSVLCRRRGLFPDVSIYFVRVTFYFHCAVFAIAVPPIVMFVCVLMLSKPA